MWRFLVRLFALIGFLTVVGIGVLIGVAYNVLRDSGSPPVPDRLALTVDLRQPIADAGQAAGIEAAFAGEALTLADTIRAIDAAAGDPRVVGLLGLVGEDVFSLATAQELASAVRRFRAAGKPALAYADSIGEAGAGNAAYYLATAFDDIVLAPVGHLGVTGIRAEVPFAREALDGLGIEPLFARAGDYKSFPESFTQRDFTAAHREMVESLVGDLSRQLITGIAEARGIVESGVAELINRGPLTAGEAEAAGLVDQLGYRRDAEAALADQIGGPTATYTIADYADAVVGDEANATRVALIFASGTILPGPADDDAMFGPGVANADSIAEAITKAVDDPGIAAILLRIDSPGGSATASAVIGRAVAYARERDKPLIASMGAIAASGGYWIAAYARTIVAEPATLTGSIGVFGGKVDTAALWRDLGVNWGGVQAGNNADYWSLTQGYSALGEERLQADIAAVYEGFKTVVAEGRGLPPARVEEVAQGRVWTGSQAVEAGLVDQLGGTQEALVALREALGLAAAAPLALTILPEPKSPFEQVFGLFTGAQAQIGLDRLIDARLRAPLEALAPLTVPGAAAVMTPLVVR